MGNFYDVSRKLASRLLKERRPPLIQTLTKVKSDPIAGQRPSTAQPMFFFFHYSSTAVIQATTEMSSSLLSPFVIGVMFSFTPLQQNARSKGCRNTNVYVSFHLWMHTADWRAITVRCLSDKSAVHVGGTRRAK